MVIHEYGDNRLPKTVLLHPMLADARCMRRLTESMEGAYCAIIPDLSGRIFIEVGSKDMNCKQNATILKHYPGIRIQVREGYGHCMYLSEHYAEYGKLMEKYMSREEP